MALNREQKAQVIQAYGERLGRAQLLIWTHYQGLDVAELTGLRRRIQDAGGEAVVVKNTLMRIAMENADMNFTEDMISGPCIVTFAYEEVAPATKVVVDFARTSNERMQVIGGIIEGRILNPSQVQELTTLPTREELLARVLGGIQAPMSGLVGTLSAVLRGFLTVLNARSEQMEGAES